MPSPQSSRPNAYVSYRSASSSQPSTSYVLLISVTSRLTDKHTFLGSRAPLSLVGSHSKLPAAHQSWRLCLRSKESSRQMNRGTNNGNTSSSYQVLITSMFLRFELCECQELANLLARERKRDRDRIVSFAPVLGHCPILDDPAQPKTSSPIGLRGFMRSSFAVHVVNIRQLASAGARASGFSSLGMNPGTGPGFATWTLSFRRYSDQLPPRTNAGDP